ncbi:hypothetical protein C0J52_18311 [Blattella germanica]|nr:hypothetical protein C0J52_18311 [Blattella germanica]
MRKDKDLKKLAVLEVIKDKKEILFGNFNNKLTQADKQAAWTEVLQRAQSLQLVGADKTWTFARDNLFGLWKCRALAKRDNAKKTGTGGGKSKQPDEVDEAIYDILERDSVVLDGLNLPESNVGSVSILERLKALKLERELGIPPSPITSTVCSFPMEESSGDACDDTVVLFNGNMNIAL